MLLARLFSCSNIKLIDCHKLIEISYNKFILAPQENNLNGNKFNAARYIDDNKKFI